ncbi:hypothetical protein [Cellulomonas rhizosphaerae]|uniref:hypothetical protein n=1 Tax=Cellulomonas rhizosphaerae TaxID=2293719 RepID=UPI001F2511EB|nr:hypothetical protein [Cellulomonas rhizosphaerae]
MRDTDPVPQPDTEPDAYSDGGAECDPDTIRDGLRTCPRADCAQPITDRPFPFCAHLTPIELAYLDSIPHQRADRLPVAVDHVFGPEPDADIRRALGDALGRS